MSEAPRPTTVPVLDAGPLAPGYAQGHARGYSDGAAHAAREAAQRAEAAEADRRRQLARLQQDVRAAVDTLEAAALSLGSRMVPAADTVNRNLALSALELAETLLGSELSDASAAARSALARALSAPTPSPVHRVRVNPAATAMLAGVATPGVEIISDPAVQVGDALAEYEDGYLDASLSAAVSRARETLTEGLDLEPSL